MIASALLVTPLLGAMVPTEDDELASTKGVGSHPLAAAGTLEASLVRSNDATRLTTEVRGASGASFVLVATPTGRSKPYVLGAAPLDPHGAGSMQVTIANAALARLPMNATFDFAAFYVDRSTGKLAQTPWETVMLGAPPCELLGFNVALGDPLENGEEIAEQYAALGIHISAENKDPSGPDKVIIYDSGDPTNADPDLMTPGPGPNNTVPLGNLMIVAENCDDMNGDGLVDVPDDEASGGIITFEFDDPVRFCSITLVDLDDGGGSELRFFQGATQVADLELPPAGQNSVTTVVGLVEQFDRMEVDFVSSGGIANFGFAFCPTVVSFDTFTSGIPTDLQEGEELTGQLSDVGFRVSATNNDPSHPDKAILFDSGDPTGEDPDLQTPGPGVNNDTPRGLVLILAEDDVDANADGLVDDPDDEAAGGVIAFDFVEDVSFLSATVLDVDMDENSFFELYDAEDDLVAVLPLAPLGNNSSQTITDDVPGLRRIELHLGSSGALAELQFCPSTAIP